MAAAKGSTKSKAKKAAEPEPTEELVLDEVDGDEAEETSSKKKGGDEVTFGASDLAKYLTETTGKSVTARELRTLIRKMARDGSARVNREITAGNRTRYNWSGVEDPEVQAIIAAFKGGELEADKQAKLAELKANKAKKTEAKKAEKAKAEAKGKKGKKADKVEASDDDELELDD